MRSSVRWSNTRAAIIAHMPAIVRGDVLDRLARVETDLFGPDVDRVTARASRPPSRSRSGCVPKASRTAPRRRARRARPEPGRDRPSTRSPGRARRRGEPGRDRRLRGTNVHAPPPPRQAAATIATASSISASVTSNDGASRSALAGHRVQHEARIEASLRDNLGVEPGSELGRDQQARRRARRPRRRPSAGPPRAAAPARAARSWDLLAFHHRERRERRARGERLAAERRRVIAGRERGGDVGSRPARTDRHRRCRAPWPS